MHPIAPGIAAVLGVNPDSALTAVAIGTFRAFITPIWQQNDALILGRCDFRFGDYWKQGLPLEVLVVFSHASGARPDQPLILREHRQRASQIARCA